MPTDITEAEALRAFVDFLNEPGDVLIAGRPFMRSQILWTFDPVAYREAFDTFVSEHDWEVAA